MRYVRKYLLLLRSVGGTNPSPKNDPAMVAGRSSLLACRLSLRIGLRFFGLGNLWPLHIQLPVDVIVVVVTALAKVIEPIQSRLLLRRRLVRRGFERIHRRQQFRLFVSF